MKSSSLTDIDVSCALNVTSTFFFIAKGDIFTIHSGLGDFELFIDKNVDI